MLRRILTYLLSSGITVIVDFSVFTVAARAGAGVGLATALGRAFAAVVNFTINRKAVFHADGNVFWQFLKYILLVAVSGTVSAFAIKKAETYFSADVVIIKAFVECVLFVFNYLVQHFLIFRVRKAKKEEELSHAGN